MVRKRKDKTQLLFRSRLNLTCSTDRMAELLDISPSHLWNLYNENKTPAPVFLGRCLRWPVAVMEAWITAGCPDRPTWENMKLEGTKQ
jgi:predicted DNA-binding transcriptional regulator AlpA